MRTRLPIGLLILVLTLFCAQSVLAQAGDVVEKRPPASPSREEAAEVPPPPPPFFAGAPVPGLPASEWYLYYGIEDACKLYVREFGDGPTVVVLHGGWGAEHSYLLPAFWGLWDRYHLVFYDMRGSLRSPCPADQITVAAHVADLDRLRQQLGLERLTLFAHSMGTRLAYEYLAAHPDRVGGLVLVGALPPRRPTDEEKKALNTAEADEEYRQWIQRPAVERDLKSEGLDRSTEELSDEERTQAWRIRFTAANAVRVDRWRRMLGGQVFYSSVAGKAAAESIDRSKNFVPMLRRHPYPITVIVGDHDLFGRDSPFHRHLFGSMPNAELVVLEDAGHAPWIDRPADFRSILVGALDKAVRATAREVSKQEHR